MARDIMNIEDEFENMRKKMNKLMNNFFTESFGNIGMSQRIPAVDVYEGEDSVNVSLDLPGLNKEDIKLEYREGNLLVKGERNYEDKKENKDGFHQLERRYTGFSRVIPIPANVDENNIKAEYKNGVLEVTLPKLENNQGTKYIDIN